MKEFFAIIGVIIILLYFPLQNILDVVNHNRINNFNLIVHRAAQKARIEGCFSEEIIEEMIENIQKYFPNIDESEIYIEVTTNKVYRLSEFDPDETINYKISVPIKKILALNGFFGIPDDENRTTYTLEGYVLSEVLP